MKNNEPKNKLSDNPFLKSENLPILSGGDDLKAVRFGDLKPLATPLDSPSIASETDDCGAKKGR